MHATPNAKHTPNLTEEPQPPTEPTLLQTDKENLRECTFRPKTLNTRTAREIRDELKPWAERQ